MLDITASFTTPEAPARQTREAAAPADAEPTTFDDLVRSEAGALDETAHETDGSPADPNAAPTDPPQARPAVAPQMVPPVLTATPTPALADAVATQVLATAELTPPPPTPSAAQAGDSVSTQTDASAESAPDPLLLATIAQGANSAEAPQTPMTAAAPPSPPSSTGQEAARQGASTPDGAISPATGASIADAGEAATEAPPGASESLDAMPGTPTKALPSEPGAPKTPVAETAASAAPTSTPDRVAAPTSLPPAEPIAARAPATPAPPPPAATVAAEIVRHVENGASRFEVRLDPPELGKVEVRLEMSRDQRVSAVVLAENPQTLSELMRSARDLERALSGAGLQLGESGLRFDASGGSSQQRWGQGGDAGPRADAQETETAKQPLPRAERRTSGRIDLLI